MSLPGTNIMTSRQTNKLTEIQIRNAKPKEKQYSLVDGEGLYLLIKASGGKYWRMNYRFANVQYTLSFGLYPEVSLKTAREKRREARQLLSDGIDPRIERRIQKTAHIDGATNTFEAVAREWLEKNSHVWKESHLTNIQSRLERDIFPWLGSRPITAISPVELLTVLQRIEKRGARETAHRAKENCGQIFRYAVATGRATSDPSQLLKGALAPAVTEHMAAIVDPVDVGRLLRMLDGYQGSLVTRCALQLAPLVFVRPGELRQAEWKDINFDEAEWRFVASKTQTDHIVPLSRQALHILEEIRPLTGHGRYVFPSARTDERPMSENAVLSAMRRMHISKEEMTGHGFRAMARTLLHEQLKYPAEVIEHQLAHKVPDALGAAYNRTRFLADRKEMMQSWADYLDRLKACDSA